ncbi:hypothetical protein N7456_004646 [Penicillium angulare]|uniref:Uncharacterized protein n=1 Tax=Penicillium angulare TaxID=116970 RepID=A0A9W9KJD5_9EURO|nr:hypothetical protein N7456_004646 [Penicillium angulare]
MQSPAFGTTWANIEDLSLQWTMDGSCELSREDFDREAVQTAEFTIGLVQYTTRLKRLDLDFDLSSQGEIIMQRLSNLDLCQLQELTLGHLYIEPGTLLSLLQVIRNTLRVVSLSFITMVDGGWDRVLKGLGNELPLLQSIKLQFLRQRPGPCSLVHFPRLSESLVVDENSKFTTIQLKKGPNHLGGSGVFNTTIEYSGRSMNLAIEILRECLALR